MIVKITLDDLENYSVFLDESRTTLDNLEARILALENCEDMALVDEIFRGLHSMKGVASYLQLTSIQKLSHHLESVFDSLRKGRIQAGPQLVSDCLGHVDILVSLVNDLVEKLKDKKPAADGNFDLELMDWDGDPAGEKAEAKSEDKPEAAREAEGGVDLTPELRESFQKESLEFLEELEHVVLGPGKDSGESETRQLALRLIHSFKGNCGFLGLSDLVRLAHQLESSLDTLLSQQVLDPDGQPQTCLMVLDAIRNACTDFAGGGTGKIADLGDILRDLGGRTGPGDQGALPVGQILLDEGKIGPGDLAEALQLQSRPLGRILLDQGKISPDALETALRKQQDSRSNTPAAGKRPSSQGEVRKDLRVDVTKLDFLLDLVGELVISSGIVSNHPDIQSLHHEGFDKAVRQMAGIINDVQKVVLGLRMVPIESVFKKMIRLVHDQSTKSGKTVRLELRGEKTEVDKNIAELIADPLVHMIRNAIDHGIEPAGERTESGKAAAGVIVLEAKQEGSDISILLSDDGKGLDRNRILAKAVEKGLLKPNHGPLKDEEIFQFIFAPGFSTAERLTDTSGRGVGMDVVKSNIEKLKGKILIESRQGQGTRIDLRLPLTLSIMDGMQVRVGDKHFIIPMIAIKETISPSRDKVTRTGPDREIFHLRGKLYPILRLSRLYAIANDREDVEEGVLLLIEARDTRYCLLVDEIMGMRQTVVKSLPPFLGNITGASGCSILVNGEICLILDVEALPVEAPPPRETGTSGIPEGSSSWAPGAAAVHA